MVWLLGIVNKTILLHKFYLHLVLLAILLTDFVRQYRLFLLQPRAKDCRHGGKRTTRLMKDC